MIWLPRNRVFKNFDHESLIERGKKHWENSFRYGNLAYFGDEDFEDAEQIIAMTNITKQGGVDMVGGWRLMPSMVHWIEDYFDKGADKIKAVDGVFVKTWKSLENIGINAVKVYSENYLFGKLDAKELTARAPEWEKFYKFLYRRYFSDGVGRSFAGGFTNENEYWNRIKSRILESSLSGVDKKAMLMEHVYNAMTVMLHERTPLEFVFSERARSSQNGITLQKELYDCFFDPEKGAIWGSTQADYAKWDEALDDLIFVQQRARMDSLVKIDELRATNSTNIYGDINQDRSSITIGAGKTGYVIDRQYIRQVLQARYTQAGDADRVDRAVKLYEELTNRLQAKPEESELENNWSQGKDLEGNADPKKAAEYRALHDRARNRKIQERNVWFAKAWQDGKFGMTFLSDTAGKLLYRAATGEETVARTAGRMVVTAEEVHNYFMNLGEGGFLPLIKPAAREGEEKWKPIYDRISEMKTKFKSEDEDMALTMTKEFAQYAVLMLRRDDRFRELVDRTAAHFARKKTAIGHAFVDEGWAHDMGREEIYKFLSVFSTGYLMPQYTPKDQRRYKEIKYDELPVGAKLKEQRWLKKLLGQIEKDTTFYERDFLAEDSSEGVRKAAGAGKKEVWLKNGILLAVIVAGLILALAAKQGFKEIKLS